MNRVRAWIAILLATGFSSLVAIPVRADAELLHDQAGGLFDVSGYSVVAFNGISGTLVLRLGKPGELRYESRLLQTRRDELPLALWAEDSALVLTPLDEEDPQRAFLEVTVPPGLKIEVDVNDSVVHASGLQGEFSLRGAEVELHASGLGDDAILEIHGGSVEIGASSGSVELEGEGLDVKLSRIAGRVALTLGGSTVELNELRGGAQATVRETELVIRSMQGRLRVESEGGRLEISSVKQGAILNLDESPVSLFDVEGGVELETNGEVRFRDMKSDMVIISYGGAVRGFGNSGGIELRAEGDVVHLEQIQGALTVEGQDLRVQLKELRGPAVVRTTMSEVSVVDAGAGIEIENDFGDVLIDQVVGPVKLSSRNGDVRITELKGALELSADGAQVEVSWAEIGGESGSTVVNSSGNVVLALPGSGRCRVEAQAEYGRIDSALDEIRVSDDGRKASGNLGGADEPVLKVRAGGQLSILAYRPPKGQ